jgi:hypothetical protein
MSGAPRSSARSGDRRRPPGFTPREPRKKNSDLGARVLVAIPALILALLLVIAGGWWFTAGAAGLAIICAHEFFRMYEPVHPVRMGGFLGIIALCIAAHTGGRQHLALVVVITFLIVFLLSFAQVKATAVGVAMTISTTGPTCSSTCSPARSWATPSPTSEAEPSGEPNSRRRYLRTRPSKASSSASWRRSSPSGSRASTKTG